MILIIFCDNSDLEYKTTLASSKTFDIRQSTSIVSSRWRGRASGRWVIEIYLQVVVEKLS